LSSTFFRLLNVSFISYIFIIQISLQTFFVLSSLFVVILLGIYLKFFRFQLEGNFLWSTLLKLSRALLVNFLSPFVSLFLIRLIFVLVVSDFVSFRFVGGFILIILCFLGRFHNLLYLFSFLVPIVFGGINFLVFFMLPFTSVFFTKSVSVLESLSLYLFIYLAVSTLGLFVTQIVFLSVLPFLALICL